MTCGIPRRTAFPCAGFAAPGPVPIPTPPISSPSPSGTDSCETCASWFPRPLPVGFLGGRGGRAPLSADPDGLAFVPPPPTFPSALLLRTLGPLSPVLISGNGACPPIEDARSLDGEASGADGFRRVIDLPGTAGPALLLPPPLLRVSLGALLNLIS